MTYQEILWKGQHITVVSILSKSCKIHKYVKRYIGKSGIVDGEAKNGMLRIKFKTHYRNIPAGCIILKLD